MQRTIGRAVLLSALLAATSVTALAETTVLRGSLRKDINPLTQNENAVNEGFSGGGTIDQSGAFNALRTGSANAGGENANPPPGLVAVPAPRVIIVPAGR